MTDRYENIRKALAMGPTPGPWIVTHELRECDETVCDLVNGTWIVTAPGVKLAHWEYDAAHIAACDPDAAQALLDERDALEAENERLRAEIERLRADEEGHAITALKVTLFGRECFLPADIAEAVEQACAAREQEQSHEGQ